MQPYLFPYIGYWQLLAAVDLFIVYDNIKYTKKGWINRNRMLVNGRDEFFSLPLRKDSDSLDVCDRWLASEFNRDKLLNQFRGAYRRAPFFAPTMTLIEQAVSGDERNLFAVLHHALRTTAGHLGITTPIRVSSGIAIDHALKGQEKVLALCAAVGATTYVNAIGGMALYCAQTFREHGMALQFIRALPFDYSQFDNVFVPWLSIIDVLMFNPIDSVRGRIAHGYEII